MSEPIPHSAAGPFVAEATAEIEIIQKSPKTRAIVGVAGLLLAFVLPVLSLHFDPHGYDVRCDAQRQNCTIAAKHFAYDDVSTVAFADIKLIQRHGEWVSDDRGRRQTGRMSLSFNLFDGRRIDASLNVDPSELHTEELRAFVKAPTAPAYSMSTTSSLGDHWGIVVFFLGGLLLVAMAMWRTEVSLIRATRTIRVCRRIWPLMRRTTFDAKVDDIKGFRVDGEEVFSVMALMLDGREVCIGRSLGRGAATTIVAELRRKYRSMSA